MKYNDRQEASIHRVSINGIALLGGEHDRHTMFLKLTYDVANRTGSKPPISTNLLRGKLRDKAVLHLRISGQIWYLPFGEIYMPRECPCHIMHKVCIGLCLVALKLRGCPKRPKMRCTAGNKTINSFNTLGVCVLILCVNLKKRRRKRKSICECLNILRRGFPSTGLPGGDSRSAHACFCRELILPNSCKLTR